MTAQAFTTAQYALIPPFAPNQIRLAMHIAAATPPASQSPTVETETTPDHDGDLASLGPFAALVARKDTATEPDASPIEGARVSAAAAGESPDEDGDDDSNVSHAAAKVALRKVTGARMFAARALAGMAQTDAAKALGYKNSAQLSQWEQCKRPPPLHMAIRAAALYGVPVDFLLGVSDQTLRDPAMGLRAATVRGIRGVVNGLAETLVASISNHAALVGPDAVCSRGVLAAGSELIEAIRAAQRDTAFDEVKGLARVSRLAEEFEQRLHDVAKAVERFDDLDASLRSTIAAEAVNDAGGTGTENVDLDSEKRPLHRNLPH